MDRAFESGVIETLQNTFGSLKEKETLAEAILSASRNAVADKLPDYLPDLLDCRTGSLLEELDDLSVEVFYRSALEVSIAYMMMSRLDIQTDDYIMQEDFSRVYEFNTFATSNKLLVATSDIAEIGLREIARTISQLRKEMRIESSREDAYNREEKTATLNFGRSTEYGDHLSRAGWSQDSRSADAPAAGRTSGQVRGAAEAVPYEASERSVRRSVDELQTDGAFGGDREAGAGDGGSADAADGQGGGRDGGTEGKRSDALGGPDEQLQALSRGAGAQRSDLRLNNDSEEAGGDELPAFLDSHLMDNAMDQYPAKEQSCRERLEELQKQLETAKVEVQKEFTREKELKDKTARLEELNALLNLDGKEEPANDPDENEGLRQSVIAAQFSQATEDEEEMEL